MRYITAMLILCVALLLQGCIPSLHPLYTEKDLVFEPALLGQWVEVEPPKDATLTFTKSGENKYQMVQTQKSSRPGVYTVHLVKLNGKLFLDLGPDEDPECDCACAPYHMFFFVSQIQPSLKLSSLDPDWAAEFLKKNRGALKHEFVGKDLWITAPTEKIQKFLLKHLNTKDAFAEPEHYERKR